MYFQNDSQGKPGIWDQGKRIGWLDINDEML